MRRALSLAGLVALAAPAVNGVDGSLILVHDPPDCVIAARRPRLLACITPASQVGRAQVSFRTSVESAWTTVPLVSDAPCFSAVLPRPPAGSAALSYFLEAADRATGGTVRTSEFRSRVVADAAACGPGRVASVVTGAQRRPGEARGGGGTSPAGADTGGGGTKAVLAVLGGGAAVAGGVIAATAQGGEPSPSAPPAPAAVTTPEPNLLLPPPSPSPDPNATPRPPRDPTPAPGPVPPQTIMPAPTGGCGDRTAPTTRITSPTGQVNRSPVTINASASDNVGVTRVEFWYHVDTEGFRGAADPPRLIGSARQAPYSIQFALPSLCGARVSFSSRAYDACDNMGISPDVPVQVCTSGNFTEPRSVSWTSTLDVKGAEAQLVVNGIASQFVPAGRSAGTLAASGGELRVEAQLVRGSGAGTWLFEFTGAGTRPTRLRVLAGEAIGAQDNGVRFRLRGEAGERVVFTLALDPGPPP